MKKKTVLAVLSLSLVVGLAGVVNAAPNGNFMAAQPQASEEQASTNNQDAVITETEGATQEEATQEATTSVNNQTAQEIKDIHEQMIESSPVMAEQMQNMPMSTHQEMTMSGQMNNLMGKMVPQTMQGQKSSSNRMMGSVNRMGR